MTQFAYAAAQSATSERTIREQSERESSSFHEQSAMEIERLESKLGESSKEMREQTSHVEVMEPVLKAALQELERLRFQLESALSSQEEKHSQAKEMKEMRNLIMLVCKSFLDDGTDEQSEVAIEAAIQTPQGRSILSQSIHDEVQRKDKLLRLAIDQGADMRTADGHLDEMAPSAGYRTVASMQEEINSLTKRLDEVTQTSMEATELASDALSSLASSEMRARPDDETKAATNSFIDKTQHMDEMQAALDALNHMELRMSSRPTTPGNQQGTALQERLSSMKESEGAALAEQAKSKDQEIAKLTSMLKKSETALNEHIEKKKELEVQLASQVEASNAQLAEVKDSLAALIATHGETKGQLASANAELEKMGVMPAYAIHEGITHNAFTSIPYVPRKDSELGLDAPEAANSVAPSPVTEPNVDMPEMMAKMEAMAREIQELNTLLVYAEKELGAKEKDCEVEVQELTRRLSNQCHHEIQELQRRLDATASDLVAEREKQGFEDPSRQKHVKDEQSHLKAQLEDADLVNKTLSNELKERDSLLKKLEKKVARKEEYNHHLNDEITSLKGRVGNMDTTQKEAKLSTEIADLSQRLAAAENAAVEKEKTLASKIEDLTQSNKKVATEVEDLRYQLIDAQSDIAAKGEELEKLKPLRIQHLSNVMQKQVISLKLRKRLTGLVTLVNGSKIPDVENIRIRGKVVEEIALTERQYARSLHCLRSSFLERVNEETDFDDDKIKIAFKKFKKACDDMAEAHTGFADVLLDQLQHTGHKGNTGATLVKLADKIGELTPAFITLVPKIQRAMMTKERKDKAFKQTMFEATRSADPMGQTYGSFLILPVQRMASVINAVTHLDKLTDNDHIDKANTEKALTALNDAAASVDRMCKDFKELERLERALKFTPETIGGTRHIAVLKRKLVKRGSVSQDGHKRELVLLSDLVLLLGPAKGAEDHGKSAPLDVLEGHLLDSEFSCVCDINQLEFKVQLASGKVWSFKAPDYQEWGHTFEEVKKKLTKMQTVMGSVANYHAAGDAEANPEVLEVGLPITPEPAVRAVPGCQ